MYRNFTIWNASAAVPAIMVVSAAASPPPDVALVRKPCQVDHLLDTIRASHEQRAKRVVS